MVAFCVIILEKAFVGGIVFAGGFIIAIRPIIPRKIKAEIAASVSLSATL